MDCAFVHLNSEGEKSMRTQFFSTIAVAVLFSAPIFADEPIVLSAQQMDQITAGTLSLPNGRTQFDNFDNPSPDQEGVNFCSGGEFCHPALTRRSATALGATAGKVPSVDGFANDGPWAATVVSPRITCVGLSLPAGMGPGPRFGAGCSL